MPRWLPLCADHRSHRRCPSDSRSDRAIMSNHRPVHIGPGPSRPTPTNRTFHHCLMQLLVRISHEGYQECPSALHSLLRLDPSVRDLQPKLTRCVIDTRRSRGGSYPYSASAHSWPPPSSRAVCSATRSLNGRAVRSCLLLHLHIRSTESTTAMLLSPLLLGATEVSTQQQCAEVQNPENLPPLHILTCVQRADPLPRSPRPAQSWSKCCAVPADRCTRMVHIPLQPPTVVSTCPAHAFHPGATSELAGQDRHPPGAADA